MVTVLPEASSIVPLQTSVVSTLSPVTIHFDDSSIARLQVPLPPSPAQDSSPSIAGENSSGYSRTGDNGISEVGEGKFEMTGSTLVSENGGVFYTTNTDSEFTLKNVSIQTADDCEYLLRVTGNQNARGWGQTGSNGANCTFTAIEQALNGKVVWDSISNLFQRAAF